jgi:hypothetical protein
MQQLHRVERYLKRIRRIYGGTPYIAKDPKEYKDDVVGSMPFRVERDKFIWRIPAQTDGPVDA